ncbi:uncharacterized protein LOC106646675 [Copidosoma floridanum]|uniref:uncharacterized protein LOC106646675 n=1 Tax=Copidosoma floridanum TaxID=29053 RepID=UPI0006C9BDD6|nr:uncharacterized protein LOC106646675 [Copidosoma floridanum]
MTVKSVALLTTVVALAALQLCDAGLLKDFGRGAENLGSAINKGAAKAEDKLTSLFGGGKKKEEEKPAVPKESVLPPAVLSKSPFSEKMYEDSDAPSIEIVYKSEAASTTQKSSWHGAAVITDDTEFDDDQDRVPKNDEQERESIVGAPRCAPGEVYINQGCRTLE